MEAAFFPVPEAILVAAAAIAVLAGFVKGAVGFALPMVMISGLGSLMAPELALAALILPALIANVQQALRTGAGPAVDAVRRHWLYLAVVLVLIGGSAQLLRVLPGDALYLFLGVPVVGFSVLHLAGWRLRWPDRGRGLLTVAMAAVAGLIGGVSGVWGPPTVMYLTALDTPKAEALRVQGVIYGLGAVVLTMAHVRSGVLSSETVPMSLAMIPPALAGVWLGQRVSDRMDQARFRRATLAVLVLAGLNLIRRGVGW